MLSFELPSERESKMIRYSDLGEPCEIDVHMDDNIFNYGKSVVRLEKEFNNNVCLCKIIQVVEEENIEEDDYIFVRYEYVDEIDPDDVLLVISTDFPIHHNRFYRYNSLTNRIFEIKNGNG